MNYEKSGSRGLLLGVDFLKIAIEPLHVAMTIGNVAVIQPKSQSMDQTYQFYSTRRIVAIGNGSVDLQKQRSQSGDLALLLIL
jgi:hypothetical protein